MDAWHGSVKMTSITNIFTYFTVTEDTSTTVDKVGEHPKIFKMSTNCLWFFDFQRQNRQISSDFQLDAALDARFEALHLHRCAAGGPGRHWRGRGPHRGQLGHVRGQGDVWRRQADDPCSLAEVMWPWSLWYPYGYNGFTMDLQWIYNGFIVDSRIYDAYGPMALMVMDLSGFVVD